MISVSIQLQYPQALGGEHDRYPCDVCVAGRLEASLLTASAAPGPYDGLSPSGVVQAGPVALA